MCVRSILSLIDFHDRMTALVVVVCVLGLAQGASAAHAASSTTEAAAARNMRGKDGGFKATVPRKLFSPRDHKPHERGLRTFYDCSLTNSMTSMLKNWQCESKNAGKDVSGATLGIIGLGEIGQAVARRASGFDMKVLGFNRSEKTLAGIEQVTLQELLLRSDFVSVHIALTDDTRMLLNAEKIALMKPGSVLVNYVFLQPGQWGRLPGGRGWKAITLHISSVIPYIKVSIQGGAIMTFNVSAYVPGLPVLLSAANTLKEMGIKAIRQGGSDN